MSSVWIAGIMSDTRAIFYWRPCAAAVRCRPKGENSMPVYFDQAEKSVGRAVWRSEDGVAEVVLCSVDLTAYGSEPAVREHFAALTNAVADHHRRKHVVVPIASASRLAGIPCETCTAPEADDVRHRAGQISDVSELELSPGGFPVGCCKRRIVGAFGSQPDWSRPAARR
jgi:hypothetical protein